MASVPIKTASASMIRTTLFCSVQYHIISLVIFFYYCSIFKWMEMKIFVVSLQLSSVKLYMTQCKLCKTF